MTHRLLLHAREVITTHLQGGDWREMWNAADGNPSQGCFVSLKANGKLRGCIGTIEPVRPSLEEEVASNALAAALRDPRFKPLGLHELDLVHISIDLLEPAQPVSSPRELDPAHYGVVVRQGKRCGVLLPDIPGVEAVDQQIAICLKKGGIAPEGPYNLSRFEVLRLQE